MTKTEGRIGVFEMLFESDFHKDTLPAELYNRAVRVRGAAVSKFSDELYGVCTENLTEIDKAVEEVSENWKLSRMNCVTRAVLRTAAGELLYMDTPPKVAINEAVEISKIYNDERGTAFVNGVLNKLARRAGRISDE